jgi:hypothetical protein
MVISDTMAADMEGCGRISTSIGVQHAMTRVEVQPPKRRFNLSIVLEILEQTAMSAEIA